MSKCGECVNEGGGCCNCTDSGIFVTLHDALRIKNATGIEFSEFLVFNHAPDEWFNQLKDDDDPFLQMFHESRILQLKLSDNGCPFLSGDGCKIFNQRPGLCRSFPLTFDYDNNDEIKLEMIKADKVEDENCTLIKEHFNDADTKGVLHDMEEDECEFKAFLKKYDDECDAYLKYKKLLARGVPYEEIINKFNIKV